MSSIKSFMDDIKKFSLGSIKPNEKSCPEFESKADKFQIEFLELTVKSQREKIVQIEEEAKNQQAVIDELVRLVRIWRERTWHLEDKYEAKKDNGNNS